MTTSRQSLPARLFRTAIRLATRPTAIACVLAAVVAARFTLPETSGLVVEHFSNSSQVGEPVLEELSPEVSIDEVEDAWNEEPPLVLSARWTGYLIVDRTGPYTFALTSDDGSTLEIDEALVVDNGGRHSRRTITGQVTLDRGAHPVVIEYAQDGGEAVLDWSWSPDGGALVPVPASALSPYRIGPLTVSLLALIDAAFVPAAVLLGLLVIWIAFPPASRLNDQRRRRAVHDLA